jgi:hypothetical protein
MVTNFSEKATVGLRSYGRLAGKLPWSILEQAGIERKGHVQYGYMPATKEQEARLTFFPTEKKKGDCVITLSHPKRAGFSRFEVQTTAKRFVKGELDCDETQYRVPVQLLDNGELHLKLPKGFVARDPFVKSEAAKEKEEAKPKPPTQEERLWAKLSVLMFAFLVEPLKLDDENMHLNEAVKDAVENAAYSITKQWKLTRRTTKRSSTRKK